MELPNDLKKLYRHWEKHTKLESLPQSENIVINTVVVKDILNFASKRMSVWENKTNCKTQPYSDDNILNQYRFCNIYRELDRQTIKIHKMLEPYKSDFNLWLLNLIFCRMMCSPESVEIAGFLSFEESNNLKVYKKLSKLKSPKYGSAYIFPISVIQKSEYNTRDKFFCFYLPKIVKKVSSVIKTFKKVSVNEALTKIIPIFKYNFRFHMTEILIDVAYQFPELIDLFKSFPIGPGSKPTMQRVSNLKDLEKIAVEITSLQPFTEFSYLTFNGKKVYLSVENIEGIGCEFRKYSNLKNGKGRKRKYKYFTLQQQ